MLRFLISIFIFNLLILNLFASEAYLDNPYEHLIHPKISKYNLKGLLKSDTVSIINQQSEVKSQEARGTCSIFSATAYLENRMIANKKFNQEIDLSEEWLEYIALRGKNSDGSSAPNNFNAFLKYGMPNELTMEYIGEDWTKVFNPLKEQRCGHLSIDKQTSCLIVHRDPNLLNLTDSDIRKNFKDEEFINARKEAEEFKQKNLNSIKVSSFYLNETNEIKNVLNSGKPVILEVDFYYGAWNHSKANEYGIGRDMDQWSKGIVAYPEPGSIDLQESSKHRAGHSILVVGFDDNKVITKNVKMLDGTTKTFKYKGVYYFKNSWGTDSFGYAFSIDDQNFPGYGMITYKYAHEKGSFFQLPF